MHVHIQFYTCSQFVMKHSYTEEAIKQMIAWASSRVLVVKAEDSLFRGPKGGRWRQVWLYSYSFWCISKNFLMQIVLLKRICINKKCAFPTFLIFLVLITILRNIFTQTWFSKFIISKKKKKKKKNCFMKIFQMLSNTSFV